MKTLILALAILLLSCKTSEKSLSKVETKKDSISYVLPTSGSLVISQLCDSITGMPRNFQSKLDNAYFRGVVDVKDNKLSISIATDTVRSKFKEHTQKESYKEIITKTVWTKWTWAFLSGVVICFAFPGIPRFVNGGVKKILGFFL